MTEATTILTRAGSAAIGAVDGWESDGVGLHFFDVVKLRNAPGRTWPLWAVLVTFLAGTAKLPPHRIGGEAGAVTRERGKRGERGGG
jgi:hypothetical protein